MEHISDSLRQRVETIILKNFDPISAQGFTQVPNLILRDSSLSEGAKLVYALLLSYAWSNNRCFPGQERLAADCGKKQSWTSKRMAELQEKGFLTIQRRGLGKTNIYILTYRVTKRQRKMG